MHVCIPKFSTVHFQFILKTIVRKTNNNQIKVFCKKVLLKKRYPCGVQQVVKYRSLKNNFYKSCNISSFFPLDTIISD